MQALLDRADHVEELTWAAASPGSVTEVKMARQKIQEPDADYRFVGLLCWIVVGITGLLSVNWDEACIRL